MIFFDLNSNMRLLIKKSLPDKAIELIEEIVSHTTEINGCLLYNVADVVEKIEHNFNSIIEWHGDKTGYECSVNEIQLFFDVIGASQLDCFVEELGMKLKEKFKVGITVIVSVQNDKTVFEHDNGDVEEIDVDWYCLRFHGIHEGEISWLTDNLDDYKSESIMYCVISD